MTDIVVYSLATNATQVVTLTGPSLDAFEAERAAFPQAGLPDLSMRQFRLALLDAGLLDGVDAAINGLSEPERSVARIEFEYASSVSRSSAWIETLAAPLNLASEQIDDLWRMAASR